MEQIALRNVNDFIVASCVFIYVVKFKQEKVIIRLIISVLVIFSKNDMAVGYGMK